MLLRKLTSPPPPVFCNYSGYLALKSILNWRYTTLEYLSLRTKCASSCFGTLTKANLWQNMKILRHKIQKIALSTLVKNSYIYAAWPKKYFSVTKPSYWVLGKYWACYWACHWTNLVWRLVRFKPISEAERTISMSSESIIPRKSRTKTQYWKDK